MLQPAKEWICDACKATEIQTGPRAMELLPSPPHGWILQDTTRILPPRTSGEGASKVKMGESRETTRKSFCPGCSVGRVS